LKRDPRVDPASEAVVLSRDFPFHHVAAAWWLPDLSKIALSDGQRLSNTFHTLCGQQVGGIEQPVDWQCKTLQSTSAI
jgi:hypothetical protein